MKIKGQRELAAFMAGVEVGRIFKMVEGGFTESFVWFENFDESTQIAVWFESGAVYFESPAQDSVELYDDIRHDALQGIMLRAKQSAKTATRNHNAKKAEATEKGNK